MMVIASFDFIKSPYVLSYTRKIPSNELDDSPRKKRHHNPYYRIKYGVFGFFDSARITLGRCQIKPTDDNHNHTHAGQDIERHRNNTPDGRPGPALAETILAHAAALARWNAKFTAVDGSKRLNGLWLIKEGAACDNDHNADEE
jgi:hypothetical protein